MTMTIDKNLRAIIYCQFANTSDFMCQLSVVPDTGGKVLMTGRVRHYTGDQTKDPFEDGDRKNWMQGRAPVDFEEELARILKIVAELTALANVCGRKSDDGKVYVLKRELDDPLEEFMELFKQMPFVHTRTQSLQ